MSSLKKLESILEDIRQDIASDMPTNGEVLIHPHMQWLTDRNMRYAMFERNPECFLVIQNAYGEKIPFFPVCNRAAVNDINVIRTMIGIAHEVIDNGNINVRSVRQVIVKLEDLEKKLLDD